MLCVMSFMAAVLCELPNKFRCITTMTNKVLFYSILTFFFSLTNSQLQEKKAKL